MIQNEIIEKYSEMTMEEREFLVQTLESSKPKKILEVGIAAGANSVIILDYLDKTNQIDNIELHSCDYNTKYYRDIITPPPPQYRNSGFLVENLAPHLKDKWHLYTGGFIVNHIQKIGKDIDFCIIDTVHSAPGEAMDFLMVLPYLSKNATIILHDLGYHCSLQTKQANICLLLFLALNGLKIIPDPYANYKSMFQNIGSCILHDYDERKLEEYFRLLSFPWVYIPSNPDLSVFREFVRQHYGIKFALYFDEILILQKQWQNKKNEYAHLFKYPKIAQSINTLISCRMFPRDMIRFIKKKLHKR